MCSLAPCGHWFNRRWLVRLGLVAVLWAAIILSELGSSGIWVWFFAAPVMMIGLLQTWMVGIRLPNGPLALTITAAANMSLSALEGRYLR